MIGPRTIGFLTSTGSKTFGDLTAFSRTPRRLIFRCLEGNGLDVGVLKPLIIASDCSKSLSVDVQGQNVALYGKINSQAILWDGLHRLSSRHPDLLHNDRIPVAHHRGPHFQVEFH